MFPGTLSKDNVDGRHYNSNLNIAFVFETFVPFNICLAFGDIRSEHWKRAKFIWVVVTFDVVLDFERGYSGRLTYICNTTQYYKSKGD